MRRIAISFALLLCSLVPVLEASLQSVESQVVGLVVTYQQRDPDRPWAKKKPNTRQPSGVLVEGSYILTTARMIADATLIQVRKHGRVAQATARPFFVDYEINLALLEIDPQRFLDDLEPSLLARETPTRGVLRTVRWNGQQLELLASRVMRFEVKNAFLSEVNHVFLFAQTDMSSGGWGEPVFNDDGRLVGITESQAKLQARIIPVEIISRFLNQVDETSPYRGFPVFGAYWQVNKNPDLADYLGQTGEVRGVLIRQIPWGGSACGVLKPLDILLSVNETPINAEGFYNHPRLGQLKFTHILTDGLEVGDTVPLRVIREGRERSVEMTLRSFRDDQTLIPRRHGNGPPPYIVAGGFVFRELDLDYLQTWGKEWTKNAPLHLRARYETQRTAQRPDRRRVVLLTSVLPSPFNVGYQDLSDIAVERINGNQIDSIPDVADAFEHPVGGFHTIIIEPTAGRREIVLDAKRYKAATAEILKHYRIPAASRMPSSAPPDGGPDCPGDY